MDSSGSIRFFTLFAALLVSTGCATGAAPKTQATTRTSFEPGVQPPAENAPATAPVIANAEAVPTPPAEPTAISTNATPPPAMETPVVTGNVNSVDPVPGTTVAAPSNSVDRLNKRLDELENQVSHLTEKLSHSQSAKRVAAIPHPAEDIGDEIEPTPAKRDPEAGFVNDSAVRAYRQAMILYLSRKYADAVLSFSQFLQNYADHALAGSAQFYVGECYFQQKEYRLAAQEYSRVLTAYERSAHVTTALRQLASSQDYLQLSEEAARTRQTLSSLFPQAPASEPVYVAVSATPDPIISPAAPAATPGAAAAETTAQTAGAGFAPGGEPTDDTLSIAPKEAQGERAAAAPATSEGSPATAPMDTQKR